MTETIRKMHLIRGADLSNGGCSITFAVYELTDGTMQDAAYGYPVKAIRIDKKSGERRLIGDFLEGRKCVAISEGELARCGIVPVVL